MECILPSKFASLLLVENENYFGVYKTNDMDVVVVFPPGFGM